MSRPIGGQLYRCPRCSQAGEWTDGMSVAAGDERDEYWCQTCGEESLLSDCERVCRHARTETRHTLKPDAHLIRCLDCGERLR